MRTTAFAAISIPLVALLVAGPAFADNIDFGTNQDACQDAAHQANAGGNASAFCFQTGPGHYSLSYTLRQTPRYNPAPVYVQPAPPVAANTGPILGSDCAHAQLNTVTIASDGSRVRCANATGGYRWMIDTGETQPDPAVAGRAAWDACMSNAQNTAADCRCSVDGNCS